MDETISVVIPTKNGGSELIQLLSTLRVQKFVDFEIVLIDSGSTDGSIDSTKSYGAKIVSIDPKTFNHGSTRNQGISETCGDYIFLFTQDALPSGENYMQVMLESMKKENSAGVFSRQVPRPEASPLVKRNLQNWVAGSEQRRVVQFDSLTSFHQLAPIDQYYQCVFDNVASLIRRDVWKHIPFAPVLFGEDIDWGYRVLHHGYKIVYEPAVSVRHSHERSAEYEYKRTFIDHYYLCQRFGLRTVPSRWHVLRSFFVTMYRDMDFLLRAPALSNQWLKWFLQVPIYSYSSALGQYRGARAALRGVSLLSSQDV
jgi:rhamnosyltransferase